MAAIVIENANNIAHDFRIVDETDDYVVVD